MSVAPPPPIPLLYEDAALVVVDKPAGVPVIPAPGWPAPACVQHRVAAQVGSRLWVVHRLDRDTSGALAFARSADAHRALSMAFEARQVRKWYLAVVHGVPSPTEDTIAMPLHGARKGKTRPAAPGETGARDAVTRYRVTRAWRRGAAALALVEAEPLTGRRHQIRVHLRALGTPIVGDAVYGGSAGDALVEVPSVRLALHASRLDVPHPVSGARVVVDAPLARDFADLVAHLDRAWTGEAAS